MSEPSRIPDLLKIIDRLSTVLERETAILRARTPAALDSVRQEKLNLSAAYENHVRALRSDPGVLAAATPDVRARLKAAFDRFERILGENERGLRAARDTTDRVLRAIADEVERQRRDSLAYSANGNPGVLPRSAAQPPVSVAVDKWF